MWMSERSIDVSSVPAAIQHSERSEDGPLPLGTGDIGSLDDDLDDRTRRPRERANHDPTIPRTRRAGSCRAHPPRWSRHGEDDPVARCRHRRTCVGFLGSIVSSGRGRGRVAVRRARRPLGTGPRQHPSALPEPQRRALDVALLRRHRRTHRSNNGRSQRPRSNAMRMLAADNTLLVAIDDVQWLDPPTVSALAFAIRRLEDHPIRLVVAIRTEHDGPPDLPIGLGAWRSRPEAVEVRRCPRPTSGRCSCITSPSTIPRPRLETLAQLSQGNPMFALELARRRTRPRSAPASPSGML